jgi:urease accessory protein
MLLFGRKPKLSDLLSIGSSFPRKRESGKCAHLVDSRFRGNDDRKDRAGESLNSGESKPVRIVDRIKSPAADIPVEDRLVLPYELRKKARQRVLLQSGRPAVLLLPRGTVLYHGDRLLSDEGLCVQVIAAKEKVSVARIDNVPGLAKIAYHLGNRHVAVQVLKDRLIYLHDHVLDDMARGLGAIVTVADHPFEPEEGAYHGGGVHHGH